MAGQHPGLTLPPFRGTGALLDEHRRSAPQRVAIIDVESGTSITFGELAAVVDDIAWRLQQRGIGRGARVILAGSDGIEKLLLWLSIWRIGAVVCPLDLTFTKPAVFADLLATLNPALILAPAADHAMLLEHETHRMLRYGRWPDNAAGDAELLCLRRGGDAIHVPTEADATLHDIACISCTSGTGGDPKLVVYDHACYWYNGLDSAELLALGPHDRLLEYRPFDWYSAQILSLMPLLQLGLTLCVARRFSRSHFVRWITQYAVSVCVGVPTVINILLEAPVDVAAGALAGLRAMSCSSAPLSPLQWQRFEQRYGIRLLNLYGSSEAGWICGNRLRDSRIGTVGTAVRHTSLEIVGADGAPSLPGQAGQVRVSGAKLALGLLQRDGSLEPIRGAPYYTRDAAMRDADGFVQILGRLDDLIVRGGVKISPQTLEEVLLEHATVGEAAAVGVPDQIYGQEPACFVTSAAGKSADASTLLSHCRQHLPHEKMPKYLYVVDALPRNARGKVRRDLLRQDWWTATHRQARHSDQRTGDSPARN
jgi:long-chain acyl-CoA synthetase